MEFIYPAKFVKEDDGGYSVSFPDFYGAFTEGNDLKEAFDRAEDCLGGVLFDFEETKKELPNATGLTAFPANNEKEFITLIKIDLAVYKRKIDEKPIRKTVYISKDLNDKAELLGINFSKTLRDALILAIHEN